MNRDKLISIIVPIYNVEEYLVECLDSIFTQNMSDYEVKSDEMKTLALRDIEAIGQLLEGEGELVRA